MVDVGGAEVEGGEDGDSKCWLMVHNDVVQPVVVGTCELLVVWLRVQASMSSATSHSSHF